MNILVIKQTSLGDVLHSTGQVRALKEHYPDAHLTLLTASSSHDLYRHNPHVDDIILFDRYAIKRDWLKRPLWSIRHIAGVVAEVRKRHYSLAFDLQGLAKSALFLYAANAEQKFIKGNWPGLRGFRKRELHAIDEMSGVLRLAGVDAGLGYMEIYTGADERDAVDGVLARCGVQAGAPFIVISPFSRRESKDWPIGNYHELIDALPETHWVIVTGSADRKAELDALVAGVSRDRVLCLAGDLSLLQFAELLGRARLLISGDSFPMHLAAALGTPLVSMLGPTDEEKVGPRGKASATVIRADNCLRCDSRNGCRRRCLSDISAAKLMLSVSPHVN